MKMTPLAELVGLAEPIEPGAIPFIAKPAASCADCLFKGQRSSVCRKATEIALRSGIADCDDGFVYVEREIDPRQLALVDGA